MKMIGHQTIRSASEGGHIATGHCRRPVRRSLGGGGSLTTAVRPKAGAAAEKRSYDLSTVALAKVDPSVESGPKTVAYDRSTVRNP